MQRFKRTLVLTALSQVGCLSNQIEAVLDQARMSCSSSDTTEGTTEPDTTGTTTETSGSESATESGTTTLESTSTETTSAETTETTETTDGTPVCGNGVREAFGPIPEECDDGNLVPDDGCDETCAKDLIVFVTSSLHQGNFDGVGLGDSICINLAGDVDLPEPLNYRAWLSDSQTDARDRIKPGRGRYVLLNGLVVADSWEALLGGELQNPIDVTETMEVYHNRVWTGTQPDGTRVPDGAFCKDWTSDLFADNGHYGYSDELFPGWTLSAYPDNPIFCDLEVALYCFEQPD